MIATAPARNVSERDIIRAFVAEPAQAWQEYREYEAMVAAAPKLDWVSAELNKKLPALIPTDLCYIVARSGGGKTSMLAALSVHQAMRLQEQGRAGDSFVAYFSWDQARQTIERKVDTMLRNAKARKLNRPMVNVEITLAERTAFPLWQVGKRAGHKDGIHLPPLTEDYIEKILEYIKHYQDAVQKKCALVAVDYVQRIPIRSYKDESSTVKYVCNRLKDFADSEETIVVAGAQGQRDADDRMDIVPHLNDGRYSAAIEDSADVHIGQARPVIFKKLGTPLDHAGRKFTVTKELMIGRVNKDRDGHYAGNEFAYFFDPEMGHIGDYAYE